MGIFDTLKRFVTPIHKDGLIFVLIAAVVTLILGNFSDTLGWIGTVITLWIVYFFRDPERVTPDKKGVVVSAADGLITRIETAAPPPELEMDNSPRTRISVFLSLFDVHVNRIPVSGKIQKMHYHPGAFLNASLDKESQENERQSLVIDVGGDKEVIVTQIAGMISRRILCQVEVRQEVQAGERYGLIRFGSRVDVYLPEGVNPLVIEGQRVIAGETVLADLSSREKKRSGKKQ